LKKRVVVTGMGGLSPVGLDWSEVETNLRARRNAIRFMPDWDKISGLNTRLGAPVPEFDLPPHYTRKRVRSMGRIGILATRSAELAIEDAQLKDDPILKSGRTGVAFGSSSGSPPAILDIATIMMTNNLDTMNANTYLQMMPHTTAVNVSVFFGICGRLIPTSTACASGSLAIGLAYEAIQNGQQDVMVAGGAEELSVSQAAVFDTLYATSTLNDTPALTPKPFDADRDGMVVGEGGATLVLEDRDRAMARGATIHAEVAGFGTNCDGKHLTQPAAETMAAAMQMALEGANIPGTEIGYVNAHGTATDRGDVAETHATLSALGYPAPISSLKSYIGHTLGACGSLEAWMTIEMMKRSSYAPTVNLINVDPRCAELDYIVGDHRTADSEFVMNNNFAFGGVNTSLVFRRHE
jgi:3-oxoacyl-[acyl-carrier-protein] synthase II